MKNFTKEDLKVYCINICSMTFNLSVVFLHSFLSTGKLSSSKLSLSKIIICGNLTYCTLQVRLKSIRGVSLVICGPDSEPAKYLGRLNLKNYCRRDHKQMKKKLANFPLVFKTWTILVSVADPLWQFIQSHAFT